MKTKQIPVIFAVMLMCGVQLHAQTAKKILVAYFSHSGNTRALANDICNKLDGDIFEIKTVKTYSDDYQTVVDEAKRELKADFRPELKSRLKDINQYDIIFVGYPNWWGTYPQAVKVFLAQYKFDGKTIIPFCTHEGSRLGRSVDDMKKICTNANILDGLAVEGRNVHRAKLELND